MGYYVFSNDSVINTIKKKLPLLAILTLIFGVTHCIKHFGGNCMDAPINRSFIRCTYSWIGCMFLLGFFAKYLNYETDFTKWMSKRSFGLYLFHLFGIQLTACILVYKTDLPAVLIYLLTTVGGFAFGFALTAIIPKIPILRWCILGIKKTQ